MSEPRVRVEVNRDRCMAVQMCRHFAPGAFEPDAEMITTFLPDGTWTREQLEEAVENCPSETLTLIVEDD